MTSLRSTARQSQASQLGVTLLETAIYLAVMGVIGIPILMVTLTVSRSSAEGAMLSKIQERNRSAFQRMVEDYRPSLSGTTVVSAGGKVLQFVSYGGFQGDAPLAGPTIRYEIRTAGPAQGRGSLLVRVNQTSGEEVVLSDALSDDSLFTANGDGVTIDLNTFGQRPANGELTEVRHSLTVHPKN